MCLTCRIMLYTLLKIAALLKSARQVLHHLISSALRSTPALSDSSSEVSEFARVTSARSSFHQSAVELLVVNGLQGRGIQCRCGIRRHRNRPRDAAAPSQRARVWLCAVDCHGCDSRCVPAAALSYRNITVFVSGSQFDSRLLAVLSHLNCSSIHPVGISARARSARSRCPLLPGMPARTDCDDIAEISHSSTFSSKYNSFAVKILGGRLAMLCVRRLPRHLLLLHCNQPRGHQPARFAFYAIRPMEQEDGSFSKALHQR